jgi:hypothetical protein
MSLQDPVCYWCQKPGKLEPFLYEGAMHPFHVRGGCKYQATGIEAYKRQRIVRHELIMKTEVEKEGASVPQCTCTAMSANPECPYMGHSEFEMWKSKPRKITDFYEA